jgi:hypothetical protein
LGARVQKLEEELEEFCFGMKRPKLAVIMEYDNEVADDQHILATPEHVFA